MVSIIHLQLFRKRQGIEKKTCFLQFLCFRNMKTGSSNLHSCDLCDYKSAHLGNLRIHIKAVHLKIKDYKCEECDYRTAHSAQLKLHIKSVHLKIKDYKCEECGAKYSTSSGLKSHVNAKHEGVIYSCDLCVYMATQLVNLMRHIKAVHLKSKNYSCDDCNEKFSQVFNLKRHVEEKHKGIRHSCDQCGYYATRLGRLKVHINSVHLKTKKYTCQEWDAKFSLAYNLNGQTERSQIHL